MKKKFLALFLVLALLLSCMAMLTSCPDSNTPGGDTPGGDTPGGDTPGGDTPGGDTPGGDTPGGDEPGGDTPGGDTPGGDEPGGDTPGGDVPSDPSLDLDETVGEGEGSKDVTIVTDPTDPDAGADAEENYVHG